MIIWFCGLSGSGKTTLAREMLNQLAVRGRTCVHVDGDEMRTIFGMDSDVDGHEISGRRRNAERIFRVVQWLDASNVDVVVSVLSIFPDLLDHNRSTFRNYTEVSIAASLDLVRQRDPKGLYASAEEGGSVSIVGLGIPYPVPLGSDFAIDMDVDTRTPAEMVTSLLDAMAWTRDSESGRVS
jgi:adenylylsulfate kinase-like enzyme